jgi:hypothetical protein
MNDRDFDIVARNAVILLVAMVVEDIDKAVDCMIHIWYSALIRSTDLDLLQSSIRPLIKTVCTKIANRAPGALIRKTWTFGSRTVRLVLRQEAWMTLLSYFEVPSGLDLQRAQEVRTAVTMAHERRDYRERRMLAQLAAHRVCANKFREDGILLPFGHTRELFDTPNPSVQSSPMPPLIS